jgi:putative chitinase
MTENGWPPNTDAAPFVSISLDQCVQITIPGTTETLWFQKGTPSKVMPAFAADMNWYVESLNNSQGYNDEGTWTNGNSVGSSNHLGATAMDLNWTDHPMGPQVPDEAAGWQGSEITGWQPEEPRIRELLKFYTADDGTQLIWWGNDWDSPHDSMHFQMGYNTYQNPAVQRWIDKHIDPKTGTSDFKQWKVSQRPAGVTIFAQAFGLDDGKAETIFDTFKNGLKLAQCNNPKRIAMFGAQTRHESANFATTVEFGQGAGKAYYPYYGRGWIQLTWQSNYQKFGQWAVQQGYIDDPNAFVNNPDLLADIKWAGIVSAFYWVTPHAGHNLINDDSDRGDVKAVTYTINGGYNGLDERQQYYNEAIAFGDDLLSIIQDDDQKGPLMALSDAEQQEVLDGIRYLVGQAGPKDPNWGKDSSFGVNANGEELTQRDGLTDMKRTVEAIAADVSTVKTQTKKTVAKKAVAKKTAAKKVPPKKVVK